MQRRVSRKLKVFLESLFCLQKMIGLTLSYSAEDTADFLCKLLIEVNADKVERAIEEATKEADIKEVIMQLKNVAVI